MTGADLAERFRGRSGPVKALLLDQSVIAGVGNMYADEALWRTQIAPNRAAGDVTEDEAGRLSWAIREILQAGITVGDTTFGDRAYVGVDGQAVRGWDLLAAYGRAGEPCQRCGEAIIRSTVAGRGTHWCPRCQR